VASVDSAHQDSSVPWFRPTRRQLFPLVGSAAVAALAAETPAFAQGTSASQPAELQTTQSGTLAGSTGGAYAFYQISNPNGSSLTLTLSYAPADPALTHQIGFNVYQSGSSLVGVHGKSTGLGDSANNTFPSATITPSVSGGPVLVQVYNYSAGTITFTLTTSLAPAATVTSAAVKPRYVYIGTYTPPSGKAEGIYVYKMDGSGALAPVQTVSGVVNPSFLAIDPQQRYLYCVNELSNYQGKKSGGVSAFSIDPTTGQLTFLNEQPSNGTSPAHLSVDPTGKYVLVANYSSGNFEVLPIQSDGKLGDPTDLVQDQPYWSAGKGPNPGRQEGPHAHMIMTDLAGKNVVGVDLGLDRVFAFHLDTATGKLAPNDLPYAQVASGSGSRHIAFHPNGNFAYVICEMGSILNAFAYDATRAAFDFIQTESTLPASFNGSSTCAEVWAHPSGKFVYGSNRGHDSIVIFSIDQLSGKMTYVAHVSSGGKTPRSFNLDPSGTFLFAANQGTDNIVAFAVDQSTGKLTPTGQVTSNPTPVCVLFGRVAS